MFYLDRSLVEVLLSSVKTEAPPDLSLDYTLDGDIVSTKLIGYRDGVKVVEYVIPSYSTEPAQTDLSPYIEEAMRKTAFWKSVQIWLFIFILTLFGTCAAVVYFLLQMKGVV